MDKKTKLICILGFVLLTFFLILGYTSHVKEGVTNMDEIVQKWTIVDGNMKYTKQDLIEICQKNRIHCKGYSKMNKQKLHKNIGRT